MKLKKGVKIVIASRKTIANVEQTETTGCITFEYSGGSYAGFGVLGLIETDMRVLNNKYHEDNFKHQDEIGKQVIALLEKMEHCDTIVFQCGSAEIRSVTCARAFTICRKDDYEGPFFPGDKFGKLDKLDKWPPNYGLLGRTQSWIVDALAEAEFV